MSKLREIVRRVIKEELWMPGEKRIYNFISKMSSRDKITLKDLSDKFPNVSHVQFRSAIHEALKNKIITINGKNKLIVVVTDDNWRDLDSMLKNGYTEIIKEERKQF